MPQPRLPSHHLLPSPRGPGRAALHLGSIALLAAALMPLAGCIVVPARSGHAAPAGVAHVGPAYAIPAPGYVWAHHAHFGWGWRHPRMGWHRGWR